MSCIILLVNKLSARIVSPVVVVVVVVSLLIQLKLLLLLSLSEFDSTPEFRMYLDHEGNCKGDISPS